MRKKQLIAKCSEATLQRKVDRELNGVDLACLASCNNLLPHRKRTLNYIQG